MGGLEWCGSRLWLTRAGEDHLALRGGLLQSRAQAWLARVAPEGKPRQGRQHPPRRLAALAGCFSADPARGVLFWLPIVVLPGWSVWWQFLGLRRRTLAKVGVDPGGGRFLLWDHQVQHGRPLHAQFWLEQVQNLLATSLLPMTPALWLCQVEAGSGRLSVGRFAHGGRGSTGGEGLRFWPDIGGVDGGGPEALRL